LTIPSPGNSAGADLIQRTALYDLHLAREAKMVPFAGYSMPLQYPGGIRHEHEQTRSSAGLFDVSHMGQIRITGNGADTALEKLVTGDISSLSGNRQRYTLLTNGDGGIIDDLMVARRPDSLSLVVNAACKYTDVAYLNDALGGGCRAELLQDQALLALQGPQAAAVMDTLNTAVTGLAFMQAGDFELDGTSCFVTRSGYTGEDGFEISVPETDAAALAERLLAHPAVAPVGLGARDSLRLEAGLCLYGHDLDATTTPVEAGLAWAIAARYRRGEAPARFPGAGIILEQLRTGPARRRAGLRPAGRQPVREQAVLLNADEEAAGTVTSGGFGPSVNGPVAMGYVGAHYSGPGTVLQVVIRDRSHSVHVVALPFIEHHYHKN